ncbi:MAG: tRNA guanosine(34) transglycosylase Tgt [Alphaproteobacteria bacterium]|nr:tRNA guanosine(34) transglycosylase Tgt [Alphaproteobacteria bacterium]
MSHYPDFSFEVTHRDPASRARTGRLSTPHGAIETPNYIFCGTKATIKGLVPAQVREAGADIILSNTYHLMIQPGAEVIERLGGLHKFTGWDGPMLTDSGGYQIFSMQHGGVADEIKGRRLQSGRDNSLLKITEEGAEFRKYTDGTRFKITPEISIDVQRRIGADLIVAFDELTAYHDSRDYTARSMERTHRWEDRCLAEFERGNDGRQALYGVVQGGVYDDLRRQCTEYTADRPFFGTAVGGCLGGNEEEMRTVVGHCMPYVHAERPVHLLGIGRIKDVFEFVRMGIDTFDCVVATRMARHGMALVKGHPGERINLRNACYREDPEPLDERMDLPASRRFSRGYLHHLLKANESVAGSIITQHNIAVMAQLMREIRLALPQGQLDELQARWLV